MLRCLGRAEAKSRLQGFLSLLFATLVPKLCSAEGHAGDLPTEQKHLLAKKRWQNLQSCFGLVFVVFFFL